MLIAITASAVVLGLTLWGDFPLSSALTCALVVAALCFTPSAPKAPIVRMLICLFCLYAPYSWILLIDYPWNGYRWHYLTLWPIFPGFPVLLMLAFPGPRWSGEMAMALVTLTVLAVAVLLARRSWLWAIVVTPLVGAISCWIAMLAHAVFRA